jgi:hypothetical protein
MRLIGGYFRFRWAVIMASEFAPLARVRSALRRLRTSAGLLTYEKTM